MASNDDIGIEGKHKIKNWAEFLNISSLDNYIWLPSNPAVGSSHEECSSTKLDIKDIDLYGFCPLIEDLYLVMCQNCKKVTKVQSFEYHLSECRNTQEKVEASEIKSKINSACSNDNKVSRCAQSATDLLQPVSRSVQDSPVNSSVAQTLSGKKRLTKAQQKGECGNSQEKEASNNSDIKPFQQNFETSLAARSTVSSANKHKIQSSNSAKKSYSKKCRLDVATCQSNVSSNEDKVSDDTESPGLPLAASGLGCGPGQDILGNSISHSSCIKMGHKKVKVLKTNSYNSSQHCGNINEYEEPFLRKISSCIEIHRPSSSELVKQCNTTRSANLETSGSCINFPRHESLHHVSYKLFTEQAASSSLSNSEQTFNSVNDLATLNKQRILETLPKDTINCKTNRIHFSSTVCHSQGDSTQYQSYTNHFGSSSNCDKPNFDSNLNNCSTIVSAKLRVNHSKSKGERKEYAPQPNSCHPSTSSVCFSNIKATEPSVEQSNLIGRTFNNQFVHQFSPDPANHSNKQQDTESTVSFLPLGNKQPVKSPTSSTGCSITKSHSTSLYCGVRNQHSELSQGNASASIHKSAEQRHVHKLSPGELLKQCSTAKNVNSETIESCTNFSNLHFSKSDSGQDFLSVNQLTTVNKQRTYDNSTKESVNCKLKTNETNFHNTVCHFQGDIGQYQVNFANHFRSSNCDAVSISDLNSYEIVPSPLRKSHSTSFGQSLNHTSVISKSKGERKEYSPQPNCLHPSTSSVHYSGAESPDLSLEQFDKFSRTSKNQILKQVTSDLPNLSNKQGTENEISLKNKQPVKFLTSSSVCSSFSNTQEEDSNSSQDNNYSESSNSFLTDSKESFSLSPVEDSLSVQSSISESFSNNGNKGKMSTPYAVYCSSLNSGFNPLNRTKYGLLLFNRQSDGLRKALERVITEEKLWQRKKKKKPTSQPNTESVKPRSKSSTDSVKPTSQPSTESFKETNSISKTQSLPTQEPVKFNNLVEKKLLSGVHMLKDNGLTKTSEVNFFQSSAVI